jgi:glutathione S-transferase
MITLFHFGPIWGVDDPSPFCLKVITYMRLAGIPFESRTGVRHLRAAPKGKLPYIVDDGEIVGDSIFIIEHLKTKYGDRLAPDCSTQDHGALRAICRMLDEDVYWAGVYFRWIDEENWEHLTKPAFFATLLWPLNVIVPAQARKGVRRTLYRQGLGRHTREEIEALHKTNLQAVSEFLGEKAFIAGNAPSEPDATLYAFLENLSTPPHATPLKTFLETRTNLMDYVGRMRKRLAGGSGATGR